MAKLSNVQSEAALYQSLLENTPLGVVVIDSQGKIIWLNNLAKDFLGGTVATGQIMLPSKDWPVFRELLVQAAPFYYLLDDQGFIFTIQVLHEGKTLIWMMPAASMEYDLVTMQQDLIHQRKLANLGRMMLEMAHELNNPLAGISMGGQLIEMSLKKFRKLLHEDPLNKTKLYELLDKIQQEIQKILHSASRAAALRQELLSFSRPHHLSMRPYQTSKLLQMALNNFENQPVFRRMTIHKVFAEDSPTILCDPAKLEQILYNLFNNAHEATQGKGTVWLREIVLPEEHTVLIEVEDNGPGIPPDMLDKIFSPFLTTKPRTGTGLGLSISQQIIQQHGGTFSVYNKPQSGACFQIRFPILRK